MSAPTYRRSQAEFALWRGLSAAPPLGEMSQTTLIRIKRLLDLDRKSPPRGAKRPTQLAFSDQPPAGSGVEAAFTGFNVFCLGVALELFELGFTQGEIVTLIRDCRGKLARQFKRIVETYPPLTRQPLGRNDYPHLPRTLDGKGPDQSVFMLVRKVEEDEYAQARGKSSEAAIYQPAFAEGAEALIEALSKPPFDRKAAVFEIASPARRIVALLEEAPQLKRGRKS